MPGGCAFYATMRREWAGIDRLRLDKYFPDPYAVEDLQESEGLQTSNPNP